MEYIISPLKEIKTYLLLMHWTNLTSIPLTIRKLLELPGMTEDVAAAIVMNRQSRGVYEEVEDLLMVRGMTLEIYEKIYQQITVR